MHGKIWSRPKEKKNPCKYIYIHYIFPFHFLYKCMQLKNVIYTGSGMTKVYAIQLEYMSDVHRILSDHIMINTQSKLYRSKLKLHQQQ